MFWIPDGHPHVAYTFRSKADGLHELQTLHRAFVRRGRRDVIRHSCGVVVGPQGATARAIERETHGIVMVSETTNVGHDIRQVQGESRLDLESRKGRGLGLCG